MRLVQFGLRLDFAEKEHVYTPGQEVFKAITGKVPNEPSPRYTEGFKLRVDKRKLAVIWNPLQCIIALEDVSNLGKGIETILTTLEQIRSAAPIYKLNKKHAITYWILPAPNYDFPSLEQKYREIMIAQNEISSLAYDSSVVFDTKVGEWILHHQSGPMDTQQIFGGDYLQFKVNDISRTFIFLEASVVDKKVVQYSNKDIRSYLVESLDYCKSHSDAFHRIWEGIL